MARSLIRIQLLLYNQIRFQETATKVNQHVSAVLPASSGKIVEKGIQAKSVSNIKLSNLETTYIEESKTVQSFDEVPGPRLLKDIAKFLRYIPNLSNNVTAATIQHILSTGSQLVSGVDSRFLKWLVDEYGPVVRLEAPLGGNIVILSRPEHIQVIFDNEGPYPFRSSLDCIEKYRLQYRKFKQAGPFLMHGQEWINLRSKIERPLENLIDVHFDNLNRSCERLVDKIKLLRNQQEETPKDFYFEIYKWSMDCLGAVSFNKDFDFLDIDNDTPASSESVILFKSLVEASKAIRKCEAGLKLWKFFETRDWKILVRNLDVMDRYVKSIEIAFKEKESAAGKEYEYSLVGNLMLKDMSCEDILTVLTDFMIIGVNTTAHAMAFLLYHLSRNTKVQKKLYNELKSVNFGEVKSYEQLPYLQACIKESLRLKPPIPVLSRVLQNDVTLYNYVIPKDTFVLMATNLSSLKEENFENPLKYDPDRWLNDADNEVHVLATVPFGYGPKACLAKRLAMLQLSMLTAKIIQNFRLQYNYGDITSNNQILSLPNRPLKFAFIDRV